MDVKPVVEPIAESVVEPVEVLSMPTLKKVPFFSRLPKPGDKPEYLSHEEFEKRFGRKYSESIFLARPSLSHSFKNIPEEVMELPPEVDQANLECGLVNIMRQASNKVAIAFVDDTVGYSLVALEDIPEYTVLFFYNGVMRTADELTIEFKDDVYFIEVVPGYVISPKQMGGLAAFMQHLPAKYESDYIGLLTELIKKRLDGSTVSDDEIKQMAKRTAIRSRILNPEFDTLHSSDPAMKNSFATSNVRMLRVYIRDNTPILAVQTTERIPKHGQLGFRYAVTGYWDKLGITPEYFDKKLGNVIPRNLYTRREVNWEVHNSLIAKLSESDTDFSEFAVWNFICQFNYNAALRNACQVQDNDRAVMFVKILLGYRDVLGINIDEKGQTAGVAPVHCAASVGNRDVMAVLERAGADMAQKTNKTQKTQGEETAEQLLAKHDAKVAEIRAKKDQQSLVDLKAREAKVNAAKAAEAKKVTDMQSRPKTRKK